MKENSPVKSKVNGAVNMFSLPNNTLTNKTGAIFGSNQNNVLNIANNKVTPRTSSGFSLPQNKNPTGSIGFQSTNSNPF